MLHNVMLAFGDTVRQWRLERGMSQDELAHAARVPRPNLSNIESGRSDVSVRTVRALALALGIRPGLLVDGLGPSRPLVALTRAALERIARAAVRDTVLGDTYEQALANHLRALLSLRLRAQGTFLRLPRRTVRRSEAAWLAFAAESPAVAGSLVERALEHARQR